MPFYYFLWTDEIIQHLAAHDVSQEEFEEVVCDPDRVETSRSSDRFVALGYTVAGRYLACVYEMIDETTVLPVTGYEPD